MNITEELNQLNDEGTYYFFLDSANCVRQAIEKLGGCGLQLEANGPSVVVHIQEPMRRAWAIVSYVRSIIEAINFYDNNIVKFKTKIN